MRSLQGGKVRRGRRTCVEAETVVQAVLDVSTRYRHRSPDAVHVRDGEPEVVELVQCIHVERHIVGIRFLLLLMLLATCSSHVHVRTAGVGVDPLCREPPRPTRPAFIGHIRGRLPPAAFATVSEQAASVAIRDAATLSIIADVDAVLAGCPGAGEGGVRLFCRHAKSPMTEAPVTVTQLTVRAVISRRRRRLHVH